MQHLALPRFFLSAAILLLATVSWARSESYTDWLADVSGGDTDGAVTVRFEPRAGGRVPSITQVSEQRPDGVRDIKWHVPTRPPGGLVGQIVVSGGGESPATRPASVHFFYIPLVTDDLVEKGNRSQNLTWAASPPLLNQQEATVRPEHYAESHHLPEITDSTSPASLPLVLPTASQRFRFKLGGPSLSEPLFSCLCEVRNAAGDVLARRILIEAFAPSEHSRGQATAWVMNDPEADRRLREYAGIKTIHTVNDLPSIIRPYREVHGVWISAQGWESAPFDRRFLRRLLLMGIQVYGRTDTILSVAATAGLTTPQSVLLGYVGEPADQAVKRGNSRSTPWHNLGRRSLWDGPQFSDEKLASQDLAPETRVALFDAHKSQFLGWTLAVLGGYCLLLGVGAPIAFARLRGPARLKLWLAIPAVAVGLALVGHLGGRIVLPRDMTTDLTEYRFARSGWPEVYCQSVARVLSYESSIAEWRAPPGSFRLGPQQSYATISTYDAEYAVHKPDGTTFGVLGMNRGTVLHREVCGFKRVTPPVEAVWHKGKPRLRATADCRSVTVWDGETHRVLGEMVAGEIVDVRTGTAQKRLAGLPKRLWPLIDGNVKENHQYHRAIPTTIPAPQAAGGSDAGEVSGTKKTVAAPLPDQWLALVLADEDPDLRLEAKSSSGTGRILWVVEIPLSQSERANPTEGAE